MILALAAAERNSKSVAGAINRNCKTEDRMQESGVRMPAAGVTSIEYEASSKHVI